MSMKYMKFAPCPECSEGDQPSICIDNDAFHPCNKPKEQMYRAVCANCGYETHQHKHVIDVVREWNANSVVSWPFEKREEFIANVKNGGFWVPKGHDW